ncbi:DNA-directed RNA polymerase III subunit RPC5 [Podila minutissima]|uniref:DNA-directed RNA polymerase III subunit RPC5 n=1 Tax=Podila minutissima TaxID=64525 RepID=A0A9P5VRE9_9FUNG|nr:DNA-directed RNA polymerase III subunit RPC5 [Podila minutissima]
MPPKISFKPKISSTARSRKRVVEPTEGGSDHEDGLTQDNSMEQDEDLIEDEVQKMERLEEERLNNEKYVSRATTHKEIDQVVASKAVKPDTGKQVKNDSTPLDDTATPSVESPMEPMDQDFYHEDQDSPMETEGEKEPDYADEGDELVKEIPVFLSQRLAKYLYLFQYPVRAAALPYTQESGPSKARIKPLSQLIELELPVDTSASQYNRERGEELALGMNDKALRTVFDDDLDDDAEKELLDKQTLVSSLIPNATNYLAGVLRNDEMHLTPFHGTVQLRPSFKYLDKIDEKHKQATKKVSDEENKEMIARLKAESEQKAKALQVQVRSAADSEARSRSGPNRARLAEEENWTKLDYFDADTYEADMIYDRMFASHIDELECATTVEDYLTMVSSNNSLRNVKTEHS